MSFGRSGLTISILLNVQYFVPILIILERMHSAWKIYFQNYLATYGYLKESEVKSGDPFSSDKVKMAVKQFQRNFGLRVTGSLLIEKVTSILGHLEPYFI